MDRMPCRSKKILAHHCVVLVLLTASLCGSAGPQTPHKKTAAQNDAESGAPTNVQQELVRIETGFFEAWKTKDQGYFREHMPENGVFWGETGTFSRDQEIAEQLANLSVKDAAASVAAKHGLPRRQVYARALALAGAQR